MTDSLTQSETTTPDGPERPNRRYSPGGGDKRSRPAVPNRSLAERIHSEFRRVRRQFTRDNAREFFKTLWWVVPLTVLIWVYAEREQNVSENNVRIPIKITSADPNQVVKVLSPADGTVELELFGPQTRLDLLHQNLAAHTTLVETLPSVPPGPSVAWRTMDLVANDPIFRREGISVTRCIPEQVTLDVETIEDRVVDVRAPEGTNLDSATFDPQTIRVRGPVPVLDRLQASHQLFVTADLAGMTILNQPGVHELAGVGLIKPGKDEDLTITPTTVKATLHVKAADVTLKIPTVPVFPAMPDQAADHHRVVLEHPFITNVVVTGPPDRIAQLQKDESAVRAILVIVDAQASGTKFGQVTWNGLPDGVRWVSDDLNGQVQYSITDRAAQ